MSIFEPGFLRAALAYWRAGKLPPGTMLRFYFGGREAEADGGFTFGLAPTERAGLAPGHSLRDRPLETAAAMQPQPRAHVVDGGARVHDADAQHGLTLQLEHEAQHAVRAGVLRPHVDDHGFLAVLARHGIAEGVGDGLAVVADPAPPSGDLVDVPPDDARLGCREMSRRGGNVELVAVGDFDHGSVVYHAVPLVQEWFSRTSSGD